MQPLSLHSRARRAACWPALLLALAGCNAATGLAIPDDSAATPAVNPYPPGEASPMFFRSASQWQAYAAVHSAAADARHGD